MVGGVLIRECVVELGQIVVGQCASGEVKARRRK